MHVLVLDITSPSGNYHKTLPISEQAASDPARRGNLIRDAVATYPGGKAAGWKVVDGDRIIAQSTMKTAISQTVPGVADSIHDRAHFGEVIASTPGVVTAELHIPRLAHGDDEEPVDLDAENRLHDLPGEDDPFDLSPKAEAEVQDIVEDRRTKAEADRQERIAAVSAARIRGRRDATDALAGAYTVKSVLAAYETPYGDGGDGRDPYLRDAYAAGFTEVANDFKPIEWKTPEDQSNFNGKGVNGDLTVIEMEYHRDRLSKEYGIDFWVVSHGQNRRPRHQLMRAMKKGEWVSKCYNGDYYPLGRIVGFSGAGNDVLGYRIITVDVGRDREVRFWRRKDSDVWKENNADGTFALCGGLHSARNPSF